MKTALITGAGGSIGQAFADRCAAKGYSLWLVDANEPVLERCAGKLAGNYPGTAIRSERVDLAKSLELDALLERIAKAKDLELLVNNAAMPTKTPFAEASLQYECDMVRVNSIAPLALSHAAVQVFRRNRTPGAIINVCSLAGLIRGFSGVTYAATKGFLVAFSERLAGELRGKSPLITVQALCPGIVDTPFEGENLTDKPGALVLTPEEVVGESFSCLTSRSPICIPGRIYRVAHNLAKFHLLGPFLKVVYTCFKLGIIGPHRK